MTLLAHLATLTDRCPDGYAPVQHPRFCDCGQTRPATDEWTTFVAALKQARRDDGSRHQCDVRPLIRGRLAPKHIGAYWRRARSQGLVVDTGEREQSNDVAGRNADKLDRIYAWGEAA